MTAPNGSAPVVPGLTDGFGVAPGAVSPMQMVAMMMGSRPSQPDSTTEKMSMIVQLLREVSKEDPRLAALTSDALSLLLEGPSGVGGGTPTAPAGPGTPGSMMPMGSPGSTA